MIKQITLTNFYSFHQETILLHRETNILIGINGSGKSNFLRAIKLLQEGMSDAGLYRYITEGLGTFDNIFFKGEKGGNTITLEYIIDHVFLNDRDYGYKFWKDLVYTIHIKRSPSQHNYFIEESLVGFETHQEKPYNYLQFYNGKGSLNAKSETEENLELISIHKDFDPQQLALSKIHDSERYFPQTTVRKALRDISVYDYFDTTPGSDIRRASIPRAEMRLAPNGSNLAQILLNIKNQNRPAYSKLIEAAKEVNPHFEDFGTNILPGGSIELMLGESSLHSNIHVSGISDGTLRFLCLLAILYNPNRGKLVCIDEPEVGLHPDMLHNIATAIKHAATESTIIISSHSTALLNYFDLENIRVFEKNDENETIVKQFTEADFAGWYADFAVGDMWKNGDLGGVRYGG